MKNKEKFKDKILDVVCNEGKLAVDAKTHEPVSCNSIFCSDCLFYGTALCSIAVVEWANQEYKDPIVISNADFNFLSYIKDEFEYMARDEDGRLFAHAIKPKKYKEYGNWIGTDSTNVFKFNVDFPMIKWSDDRPWKISDLKKLKVVKNY